MVTARQVEDRKREDFVVVGAETRFSRIDEKMSTSVMGSTTPNWGSESPKERNSLWVRVRRRTFGYPKWRYPFRAEKWVPPPRLPGWVGSPKKSWGNPQFEHENQDRRTVKELDSGKWAARPHAPLSPLSRSAQSPELRSARSNLRSAHDYPTLSKCDFIAADDSEHSCTPILEPLGKEKNLPCYNPG